MIDRITQLLSMTGGEEAVFPATDLYNEGWMLRLVIDWFDRNRSIDFELRFEDGARWYSEALLPSAFLARRRGDKLAESWTHADGVIGHFEIGSKGTGDLSLAPRAKQLVVTEAKMFSKLSPGVTNAKYFNQAARNVACLAEVAKRANRRPSTFDRIGFFVIAPESRIEEGVFVDHLNIDGIKETVERRVSEYEDESKRDWYETWFLPIFDTMSIRSISWEEILSVISASDSSGAQELSSFYGKCLEFNEWVGQRF